MNFVGKCASLIVVILALCSVSVRSESQASDSKIDQESLNLLLNPNLLRALSDLLNDSGAIVSRQKRFSPVDSKVTKLKVPKSEQHDDDVPVIRGLAGLSPIELRLLNQKEEQQDDGKLIRTTTEKTRAEKSIAHKKKDDDDVPIITGTKDANNPSRQDARAGKTNADDGNTVVLLNGATGQRAPGPPASPPPPSFHPPLSSVPPPPRGARTRCQQRKLLLQLDDQLAVLRKLNEQREADIARSLSWVDGAGGATADQLRPASQQIPNVPIPYFPYVSNLPIYGRSDWTPLPLQPSYEYQVSGNRGPPIAGVYRRTWLPSHVPDDDIDCDYEDDQPLHNPGGIIVSTPAPNNFRGPGYQQGNPGLYTTSAPNNFRGPGRQGNPGLYATPAPNNFRGPGYQQGNPGQYTTPAPNNFRGPGLQGNPGLYTTSAPNNFQGPGYQQGNPGLYTTPAPNNLRGPGYPQGNPGLYTTPAPNNFRGPGYQQGNPGLYTTRGPGHHQGSVQVSPANNFRGLGVPQGNSGGYGAPMNFRGPGFDDRGLRYPGSYGSSPTPGVRRDGYGRAWGPKIEVDDKVAEPEDDPAEDEEKE